MSEPKQEATTLAFSGVAAGAIVGIMMYVVFDSVALAAAIGGGLAVLMGGVAANMQSGDSVSSKKSSKNKDA